MMHILSKVFFKHTSSENALSCKLVSYSRNVVEVQNDRRTYYL